MTAYEARAVEFWSLAPEWDELAAGSPQGVFATPAWHRLWCEAYAGERALHFFAVRQGERLVAVAPLMWEDNCITRIGADDLWDYQDLVVAPDADASAVIAALLEAVGAWPWESLVLPGVPQASPTRAACLQLADVLGYECAEELAHVAPKATLPTDWESYLGTLSKKDRHELRRKFRRLEQAGQTTLETIAGPEATEQDLDDFFHLHRLSKTDKAAFMTADRAQFFTAVLREPYPTGPALLFFLRLNDKRVASAVCFDSRKAYLLYNSGYDPRYASYSVGLLLKALCIRHAIEAGRSTFDFLRGSEPYKYDLGGHDEALYRLTLRRKA
jgi:CelD/BcsL family acetyltransferase involved in cellulose biosynthesis